MGVGESGITTYYAVHEDIIREICVICSEKKEKYCIFANDFTKFIYKQSIKMLLPLLVREDEGRRCCY